MDESTSAPSAHPVPPGTPTREESERRERFQAENPRVGFSPLPRCEDPEKRWTAYWWGEDEQAHHVTGKTLGDVLDSLAEKFGGTP